MKLIHISDLHLGKRLNEYSLIEDQKYILNKICEVIGDERADCVLIAGDVYDKAVPSAEAVQLFDDFLTKLSKLKVQIFIISGNHDSPERLSFGAEIMENSGIHISHVYDGVVEPVVLSDEYGDVNIYMLPFVKPSHVRSFFPDEEIESYTDGVRVAVEKMGVKNDARNIIVAHQFVTGAKTCESEEISVGGSDNVDAEVFKDFDYVALGHIHGPQRCGEERIRYCGTPLKYSFSEANHKKSVTVVDFKEKGNVTLKTVPLKPLRDMKEIKGKYEELVAKDFYDGTDYATDYMHVTLTDEEDIPDVSAKLRAVYKNLMKVDYDNTRTRTESVINGAENIEKKSPFQLFAELYQQQNGKDMSEEQATFLNGIIEKVWEGEV